MNEPVWIDTEDCLSFHDAMLAHFGGLGGVRDMGLLESAIHRTRQLFAYGQPTLFEMAAAYALGIAKNYPFLDGNKRAAFMAAATFLEVNGQRFSAPEEDVVLQTLGLAAGEISEAEYAVWLERACAPPAKRKEHGYGA